ncbi:MAG: secretin N-terminal domain-containing protein [Candidatus Omnitrophota bacterium]
MFRKILVIIEIVCLFFLAPALSFSQEPTSSTAAQETPAQATVNGTVNGAVEGKTTASGNVTIDFKDADINNVLRILSYKSNVNIVAGKDVQGLVTIRLVDVPWEKALDVVLKTYGFAYEREGNIIRVATVENLGQEPLKTEVFNISYGKSKDIAESIKEMVSERGSVKHDTRSNTIIVTDIPTNVYKIGQIITKLDAPTPQVYIDAKIVETVLDDDETLGIDWTVQITASGSQIPTTLPFNRDFTQNRFMTHSMPMGGTEDGSASDLVGEHSTDGLLAPRFPTSVPQNFTFGTLDFTSLQAVLYALNTRSNTKIISNPRMVTLDNQPAEIRIGSSLYIPVWTESETTGRMVFSDIKKTKLDTGISLKVTPHVNSKEEIVVDVEPEITSRETREILIGATSATSSDAVYAYPTSVRSAKTQVMIKDGQTIAIGGLLNEEKVKERNKVPFLGDIPLLGYMFRYSNDEISTRDLLIFVTVQLVETKKDTEPLFNDIATRMDKLDNSPTALGHQYEPDTPVGTEQKKKITTNLLVE